jgi:lysozyme family protein
MTPTFLAAVAIVLRHEGGYVNDPKDPGGETNFGISKRSYPSLDIKNLTADQAKEIYFRDFWIKNNINLLPVTIAPKVLDTVVLAGPEWGARLLQLALVGLGQRLTIDCKLGVMTAAACQAVDPGALLSLYCNMLDAHYRHIADSHPDLVKFLRGWEARAKETDLV